MNSRKKPKILLLPDVLDWATGSMAKAISATLADDFDFDIFPSVEFQKKRKEFGKLVVNADIVYWLSHFNRAENTRTERVDMWRAQPQMMRDKDWPKVKAGSIVTTTCEQDARYFREHGARVVDFRQGIDSELFKPLDRSACREKWGIPESAFVVGFCGKSDGQHGEWKRPDVFVETVCDIPDVFVAVFGRENERLVEMLKSKGIPYSHNHIDKYADMSEAYSAMDALLITSCVEGAPSVSLEAMACGVPVVSTPVGHMEELVANGSNGWIATDSKGLAFGLGAVYADRGGYGGAARATAEQWTWKRGLSNLRMAFESSVHVPSVSVLMCAYNAEKYIRESLDSILSQTYQDFEVVVVDDASTDSTPAIIASYSDPRINRITLSENIGLTRALNIGWRECRGEYVARQDADDISEPTRIEKEVKYLEDNRDFAMCGSWFTSFGGSNNVYERPATQDEAPIEKTIGLAVGGATFRRQAVVDIGGHDENFRYAQDYKLLTDLRKAGWRIASLQESLYRWRVGHGHISKIAHGDQSADADRIRRSLDLPRVGILVIAYNRVAVTRLMIECLMRNTPQPYTLYLLNNGSTDETGSFFDELAVKHDFVRVFHSNENLGCPGGREYMMRRADNELIAWLDNDMFVRPGWLPPLVAKMDSGSRACVVTMLWYQLATEGGAYAINLGGSIDYKSGDHVITYPNRDTARDQVEYFSGGASMLRRAAYNWSVPHGLDVANCEDIYCSMAFKRDGWEILTEPASMADHRPEMHPGKKQYHEERIGGGKYTRLASDRIKLDFGVNPIRNHEWARSAVSRVLLIWPPNPPRDKIPVSIPPPMFPQGLGFISSYLKARNQDVRILDYRVDDVNIELEIKDFDPDWVGVYCTSIGWSWTRDYLKSLRGLTRSPIVVGGPHASVYPDSIPDCVDHVVVGEGEVAMWGLIKGALFDRIITADRITDLDTIPWPEFEQFAEHKYQRDKCEIEGLGNFATLNTSRGCPFACKFCSSRNILSRKWTSFSPSRVEEAVTRLKSLGYKSIYFREDNFTVNQQRAVDIASVCGRNGMAWATETRVDTLDAAALGHMARMGCVGFYIGVESGSQRILDAMNKGITVEQIKTFFAHCSRLGIKTYASLIMGYPGETEEDIKLTEKLISEIKPDKVGRNVFIGMPGCEDAAEMIEGGRYEYIDDNRVVFPLGYIKNATRWYGGNRILYKLEDVQNEPIAG